MKTFQVILNNEIIGVEVVGAFMSHSAFVILAKEHLGYPKECTVRMVKKFKS